MTFFDLRQTRRLLLAGFFCLTGLSLGVPTDARADFRHAGVGPRPKGMGSAYVAVADDANAVYWNPAGLAANKTMSFLLANSWLYGVTDLDNYYMALALPQVGAFSLGMSWVRLGITNVYSEDTINLAVATKVPMLPGLSAGLAAKMFLLNAPGYDQFNDPNFNGGDHGFSLDLGLRYDSGRDWTLGATVYNLHETELQLISTTSSPDRVFTEWAVGGSYMFRNTLLMTADLRNREGRTTDVVVHGGAEIWFFDALALRTGLDRGMVTIGAGLQDKFWQADISLETDNNLGNIYMLSFTVRK